MGEQLRSALLAGFAASTIFMFISVAVDSDKTWVLVGGLVMLIGTTLITAAISAAIRRGHATGTRT